MHLEAILGDITTIPVDAIVNAANNTLLGGGGVDGAIHRAAGPELLRECKTLGGCETGDAKVTKAYNLPAEFVIHAVGPVYKDGRHDEANLLASCYNKSIQLALGYHAFTVSFPCISTGVYHYPKRKACSIAVETVANTLRQNKAGEIMYIKFICYDHESLELYEEKLSDLQKPFQI